MIWLFILIFISLILIVYKLKKRHIEICSRNIPGDKPYPFIGNADQFFKVKDSADVWTVVNSILCRYHEYGITKFWFGPVFGVALWKPEYIEIVANHPASSNKSPLYNMIFGDVLNGLFVADGGPKVKELRKPLLKTLLKKSLDNEYHNTFVRKTNNFVEYLKERIGLEFDVIHPVSYLFIDIFSETHLGVYTNEIRESRFNYFENFDIFLELTLSSIMKYNFCFWRMRMYFTHLGKMQRQSRDQVNKFHQWVLDERKKCAKERDEFYPDFLLRRAIEKKLPPNESAKELGDVVIGGSDTSTVVTASSLMFLAMFPEAQEEAYKEQFSIFGDSLREPTSEDIASMEYLTMVVKESLRLVAPPAILKTCCEDVQVDKYTIPKGTVLYLAIQKVHKDKRYWEKPYSFYPNHFLPENEAARPRYAYFPFGCGPRMCPGFQYGITAIKTILSAVLRNFKITTNMKYEDIVYDYKLMLQMKTGYRLKLEKRNKS